MCVGSPVAASGQFVLAANSRSPRDPRTWFEKACHTMQGVERVTPVSLDEETRETPIEADHRVPVVRTFDGFVREHGRRLVGLAYVACQGPSDEPTISDTIADPVVYPTPTEALEAYVETVDRWPNIGYFELLEPDGTITYGRAFEPDPMVAPTPDDGLVIAVSVVPLGDGWAVDAWESSGC